MLTETCRHCRIELYHLYADGLCHECWSRAEYAHLPPTPKRHRITAARTLSHKQMRRLHAVAVATERG